ncbi:MAG: hypothetical protein JEZ09_06835 [Salinivirgaceae bacterium]|nr:hypothetical protein [Salinivirgaceae bacterium]
MDQQFIELFNSIDLQQKSNFLLKIIGKDISIKNCFVEQFKQHAEDARLSPKIYNIEELIQEIDIEANEFAEVLSQLDFEETDWHRWTPCDEYVPDYEIAQKVAQDEAEEIFSEARETLEYEIKYGTLCCIVKEFIVIVHAASQAEINDPYCNLSDPANEYFIDEAIEVIKKHSDEILRKNYHLSDYESSLELIFAFNSLHYASLPLLLESVSVLLYSIIRNQEHAEYVWMLKGKYNTKLQLVPKLNEHICSLLNNRELWINELELCFLEEYNTSLKLMDYYFKHDIKTFNKKTLLLADRFKSSVTGYLIDKIEKETTLHIKLLKEKVEAGDNRRYFNELKKYLKAHDLKAFIALIGSKQIQADLYICEKMYDELEKLIKGELKQKDTLYSSLEFDKAVKGLYTNKPDVAWELTQKEISKQMKNNRGRGTYAYIAKLLKQSGQILGKAKMVNDEIIKLFNHQPRLPALKDEFKKTGIV